MKKPLVFGSANQRGITLLEVMVAVVILSVSLLLLLNMAMVALRGNDWSNKTTQATQLLQDKLEELRGTGVLTAGSDVVSGISRSWTITNAGSHLRRVDVQVTWQDVRSRTQTNTMTAFIKTTDV